MTSEKTLRKRQLLWVKALESGRYKQCPTTRTETVTLTLRIMRGGYNG